MRAVLVAMLLLPAAAAQADLPPFLELQLEEPPVARPLQGPVSANVTLRVSCALVDETGRVPIAYALEQVPTWAQGVISPGSDVVDPQACEAGYATKTATVTLAVTDQAPARTPTPFVVTATAGSAARDERATATANVTAAAFAFLDVQLQETVRTAPPGVIVVFLLPLTNLGNAEVNVTAEPVDAAEGLELLPTGNVTLGSKQQGDVSNSGTLQLRVRTAQRSGLVNEVGVVTVQLVSRDAADAQAVPEVHLVSLVITTKSELFDRTPAPGAALVALAVLLAVGLARRRRR